MTGQGHRWTGIGAAFIAATLARAAGMPELVAAVIAGVSCTIPDWVEIPFYRNGKRAGSLISHRTITHWPPLWIALAVWGVISHDLTGTIALGAAIGALTHILGDCPNPMGIPWLWPTKRLRIGKGGLWRSGKNEIWIILVYTFFGFMLWRVFGGWRPGQSLFANPELWLPAFKFTA